VLPQVARQPHHLPHDLHEERDRGASGIDSAIAELRAELVVLVGPAVRTQELREPVDLLEREASAFPASRTALRVR